MADDYNGSWPKWGVISHLSRREQVKLLMQCTCVRYPHSALETPTIMAYRSDWDDLLREFGTERFLSGLKRACQSTTFFPLVADIAKHIPAPRTPNTFVGRSDEDRRREEAGERKYGVPDVRCLAALQEKRRAEIGRPLTESELEGVFADLNRRIDQQEKTKQKIGQAREVCVNQIRIPAPVQNRERQEERHG